MTSFSYTYVTDKRRKYKQVLKVENSKNSIWEIWLQNFRNNVYSVLFNPEKLVVFGEKFGHADTWSFNPPEYIVPVLVRPRKSKK